MRETKEHIRILLKSKSQPHIFSVHTRPSPSPCIRLISTATLVVSTASNYIIFHCRVSRAPAQQHDPGERVCNSFIHSLALPFVCVVREKINRPSKCGVCVCVTGYLSAFPWNTKAESVHFYNFNMFSLSFPPSSLAGLHAPRVISKSEAFAVRHQAQSDYIFVSFANIFCLSSLALSSPLSHSISSILLCLIHPIEMHLFRCGYFMFKCSLATYTRNRYISLSAQTHESWTWV